MIKPSIPQNTKVKSIIFVLKIVRKVLTKNQRNMLTRRISLQKAVASKILNPAVKPNFYTQTQQLSFVISVVNDNAVIFIASDNVGNIGKELTTSSMVF